MNVRVLFDSWDMNLALTNSPPDHAWPGTTTRSSSRSRSRSHSRSRSATRTISSTSSSQVSSVRSSSSHSGTFHHPESISSASELSPILPFWTSKRHLTCGNPPPDNQLQSWRLRDKLKTVHAALILCLNIGVDPPDVFKTVPGAVLECWIDPTSLPPSKALEAISRNLQHQFEGINPRLRYKTYPEPSVDDVRKYLMTLRKSARDERVLLYYNGHGVPRPTASGEFWVFNKNHTQYIPVSIIDFQNWIGSPCILVWDCSGAGNILHGFTKFGQRRDEDVKALGNRMDTEYVPYMNSVQLASCKADETLPNAPELPADLFTSCLTSPIETALRYFVLSNQPPPDVTVDLAMQIPGDLKDRRTPLGELNWIFTAVTDTIAWTVFPRHIFRKLFRQDLMIASLFRNYLLAERIMRNYGCTPQSYPELPPTHNHPMWDSWDLAVYGCLAQLPRMLNTVEQVHLADDAAFDAQEGPYQRTEAAYEYVPSTFFAEHLSAFEVWLQGCPTITKHEQSSSRHSSHTNPRTAPPPPSPSSSPIDAPTASLNFIPKRPPDQLPILLQVLLAQAHRLRALILLSQFVDLGPWAVQLALEIGIFPYVQKLLQSPAAELKPVLIFIWARILAVDRSCQVDLLRDDGFMYFANVLSVKNSEGLAIPNAAEHRAMCAFILSVVARDYPSGQDACVHKEVLHDCLFRLDEDDFLLRQWSALCISQLWSGRDDIKALGLSIRAQEKLIQMLSDNSVEVRAAVMYALSTFLGASGSPAHEKKGGGGAGGMLPIEERDQLRLEVALATGAVLAGKEDASPMVRKELMVLMSCLVKEWRGWFVCAAWIYWEEHSRWNRRKNSTGSGGSGDIDEDLEDGIPDDRNGAEAAVAEWIERASVEDPRYRSDPGGVRAENRVVMTSFFTLLAILYELSIDPYPEVAEMARTVVDWILALLFESTFALLPNATFHLSPTLIQPSSMTPTGRAQARNSRISASHPSMSGLQASLVNNQAVNRPDSPAARRLPPKRTDNTASTAASAVSNTLKRTSSFAASLKNLAAGYAHSLGSPVDSPPSSPSLPHAQRAPASPTPNFNKPITAKLYSDVARYQSPWITPNLSANPPSPHASRSPLTPKLNGSSSNHRTSSRKNFTAVDIMSALIEEDSQRLKRRRRQPWKPIDLGLGETANVADVLPLKSGFYDWASEYYWEPLMRVSFPHLKAFLLSYG
jgi:regulator-associated protein of mTOR